MILSNITLKNYFDINEMPKRQKVLILYLANSMLDSEVIAWSFHDGTGKITYAW